MSPQITRQSARGCVSDVLIISLPAMPWPMQRLALTQHMPLDDLTDSLRPAVVISSCQLAELQVHKSLAGFPVDVTEYNTLAGETQQVAEGEQTRVT